VAKAAKKGGAAVSSTMFKPKAKKRGKGKKSWGPKDQKPKAYRGQGKS
jgi:hypothetical protein